MAEHPHSAERVAWRALALGLVVYTLLWWVPHDRHMASSVQVLGAGLGGAVAVLSGWLYMALWRAQPKPRPLCTLGTSLLAALAMWYVFAGLSSGELAHPAASHGYVAVGAVALGIAALVRREPALWAVVLIVTPLAVVFLGLCLVAMVMQSIS
jgi:hypothetical protein